MRAYKQITLKMIPGLLILLICGMILSMFNLVYAHEGHEDDSFKRFGILHMNGREAPPEFRLPNMKGEMITLSDFKGRPVFLNIMTVGCEPCQKEMPAMEMLYKEYKDKGLAVLGIFIDITPDNTKFMGSYLSGYGLTFPVLFLHGGSMKGLTLGWTPITYLIDRDGRLVGKVIGLKDWTSDDARRVIDEISAK
ncbi:MAG: TlpA family protein disulfide reductase [Nitrospirae bacterium]|nr:TlpA family protein disulfide reductase [Nitrospirota bacterium]